jgi:hypothetical protein
MSRRFIIEIYFVPCAARNSARLGLFAALGAANAAVVGGWFFASIVPV